MNISFLKKKKKKVECGNDIAEIGGENSSYIWCNNVTSLSISLLDANFNKSTNGLDSLLILYMLAKFHDYLKLITMSLIICLNHKFFNLKLYIKYRLLNRIINDI